MNKEELLFYVIFFFVAFYCLSVYYDMDSFSLKCVISDVDGKKYCVRERSKLVLAADRLAEVNQKMGKLVEHCKKNFPPSTNQTPRNAAQNTANPASKKNAPPSTNQTLQKPAFEKLCLTLIIIT